jgi:alkaline phosphatase D
MRRIATAITAVTMLVSPLAAQQEVTLSADEVLRPWHNALAKRVEMPVAPATPELAAETVLTRIAFGSCNKQDGSQDIWQAIAAREPQAFLLIGDNVYGDTGWDGGADLGSLRAAYALQASHPEFVSFRNRIPMLVTWDDHDFGFNDGGASFAFRGFAEDIFEHYWNAPADVRAREGIYFSRMYGEAGKRTQVIVLDTRYFRSDLRKPAPGEEGPALGRYLPDTSDDAQMLGEEQWRWLALELAKPADLRIVVSSIQVLSQAHGWEAWATMPKQRERLLGMLARRAGGGLMLLSGDRHSGGIYSLVPEGEDEAMVEVTSSSLNASFSTTEEATKREPDRARISPFIGEENFGLIEIDWEARDIVLSLRGDTGALRASHTIGF